LIERARAEIRQERDDAVTEVRREFADLTVLAAGKVIEKSLDKEQHRELIARVLKESSVNKKE
jgi:F-type H+-transporting ATPase subunit b